MARRTSVGRGSWLTLPFLLLVCGAHAALGADPPLAPELVPLRDRLKEIAAMEPSAQILEGARFVAQHEPAQLAGLLAAAPAPKSDDDLEPWVTVALRLLADQGTLGRNAALAQLDSSGTPGETLYFALVKLWDAKERSRRLSRTDSTSRRTIRSSSSVPSVCEALLARSPRSPRFFSHRTPPRGSRGTRSRRSIRSRGAPATLTLTSSR